MPTSPFSSFPSPGRQTPFHLIPFSLEETLDLISRDDKRAGRISAHEHPCRGLLPIRSENSRRGGTAPAGRSRWIILMCPCGAHHYPRRWPYPEKRQGPAFVSLSIMARRQKARFSMSAGGAAGLLLLLLLWLSGIKLPPLCGCLSSGTRPGPSRPPCPGFMGEPAVDRFITSGARGPATPLGE